MIQSRLNQGTPQRFGAGLPFYPELSSVANRRADMANLSAFPWVCPQNMGIPFQVSTVGGGINAWRAVSAFGTAATVTLSVGLLDSECYSGSNLLITYLGGGIATLPAGVWYFEIETDSGTIYSDYFHACTPLANESIVLRWKDTKDWHTGTYYGGGYENKMWLDTEFARPKSEYYEETVDDGFGRKIPVYTRLEEVYGFDVMGIDSMVNVLASVRTHDTITVAAPGTPAVSVLPGSFNAEDTGERGNAVAAIEVSFKTDAAEATILDEALFVFGAC